MEKIFHLDTQITKAQETSSGLKIEGYANTTIKDRTGDVIVASAWVKGVERYRDNPILLYQHDKTKPIGRVNKVTVDKKGLFVEATISSAAENLHSVHTLIKDGALKSFSVGFRPITSKYDQENDGMKITELELMEISIVSIPANQESYFSIRKAFDTDEEYKDYVSSIVTTDTEDKGIKAGLTELQDGHYHAAEVDDEGNGITTYTSHNNKPHTHQVEGFEIKEANDHVHDQRLWSQMEKFLENEDEGLVLIDNTEENAEQVEESAEVVEVVTEMKVDAAIDTREVEKESEVEEISDDEEELTEDISEDYSKPIPFVNLLSAETVLIKLGSISKIGDMRYKVAKTATNESPTFNFIPVNLNGEVIENLQSLIVSAVNLSIANVWDVDTKFDIQLVVHTPDNLELTDTDRETIRKEFTKSSNVLGRDLETQKSNPIVLASDYYQEKLNKLINLRSIPFSEWTDINYKNARRINETINVLRDIESSEANTIYMNLHGYNPEENRDMATENVGEPLVVDTKNGIVPDVTPDAEASATKAPADTPVVTMGEVREEKLLEEVGKQILEQVDDEAYDRSHTKVAETDDKVNELMGQIKQMQEKMSVMHNTKMHYQETNRNEQFTAKDMTNALFLAKALGKVDPFDTKIGMKIKAVTTVDAFLSNFSTDVFSEMEQQLVIAPMFQRIQVDARNFRVPVADEGSDTGLVAQFASGTFATGIADGTNVPTTAQQEIKAVTFTPHKFMAATHVAKDEEEDTILPLIDFLRAASARKLARSIDKSLLRGDGTIGGFNATPTNAITAGAGFQSVITGINTLAESASLVTGVASTTVMTPGLIGTARAQMGKYGLQLGDHLVCLTSVEGYNDLVQDSSFTTVDKFGPNATHLTGSLGAVFGIPIVVTEFLDVKGTTGNHLATVIFKPGFMIAERRGIELESEYEPRQQVTALYLSTRLDMKALTTVASAALSSAYSFAVIIDDVE